MSSPSLPRLQHLAPVLVVERVEPCVAFWAKRFGFEIRHKVPGPDGATFFASVAQGDIEIMYQTRSSVIADTPGVEPDGHSTVLYFTVPDLDAVERATHGAVVVKPRHKTFYGSTEIYVREPGGHLAGFAQF